MIIQTISKVWKAIVKSLVKFDDDNAIKFSASLSFYTIFAMPPMMIIIISITGFFFGMEAIHGEVYGQIRGLVGNEAALQIQDIIKNVHLDGDNVFATGISAITLLLGATGIFAEIQDSINRIWGIKAKPKRGWLQWLFNRVLSFSMIVTLGFILLVSLVVSALLEVLSEKLQVYFSNLAVQFFYAMNIGLVFCVITSLFAIIFKVLPDGKVKWADTLRGAAFTATLFMIGKFLIGYYLGHSTITSIYGAAGSVIVILLWVYYSSFILYFGAEFTMIYANMYGEKIAPNSYAVFIEKREVEYDAPEEIKKD